MSNRRNAQPERTGTEISAGILAYRRRHGLEVLLGHPGGPFWDSKDLGAWSIPKGRIGPAEDLLTAARREFAEETGPATGLTIALAPVRQNSGKLVYVFALESDLDLAGFVSNTFEVEWPPKSGRRRIFPEFDRIGYFASPVALLKIIPYQQPLLRELERRVSLS